MNGSLARSAVHGVTWLGVFQALAEFLRFVAMVFLARLLLPEDFGLVAMVAIVTTLVVRVGDMGFGAAIIQRKEITASHLSTIFWAGLAMGIIFCLVTVAISPLVADFFRIELVASVLAVSSLSFAITPLGAVHNALVVKRLQFFRFSIIHLGPAIIYMVVAVSLAFAGFGVWSLVLGGLADRLVSVALIWIICRWHPSIMFSFKSLRDLWGFGFNVTGSNLVFFLTEKLDYLITGRFLTAAALGLYSLGYKIVDVPATRLWTAVAIVAFPTFSIVQDEDERLRRGFTKSVTYLSLIAFPLFVGLAIVAPELVRVAFGQKWAPAILPMQILCVMAAINSISVTFGSLFRSKGRPDIELKFNLVRVALLAPCLLIGVRFGTVGVALGVSAVAAIIWLPRQMFANRLIGLSVREYFASLCPAAFGSVVMALPLLTFRYAVASFLTLSDVWLLISSVLLGAIIYFVTLKAARTEALDEMIELVLEMARPYLKLVIARKPLAWGRARYTIEAGHEETK